MNRQQGSEARRGILAVGTLLVDHVQVIDEWPEQGRLATIRHSEDATGGAVPNVLRTLARLQSGLPLAAAGLVGRDGDGALIRAALESEGIDCARLEAVSEPTSMTQVITVRRGGQRTFFHQEGANRMLDAAWCEHLVSDHKIVHLAYLLLLPALEAPEPEFGVVAARVFARLQARGYLTSLDLVSVDEPARARQVVLPVLPFLDYLIINELEAQTLTGLPLRIDGALQAGAMGAAAQQLLEAGVRQVVVIHCPQGAWAASRRGECCQVPSYWLDPAMIAGTVGAGDAFCAGVLYGLHEGWPLVKTLRLGNASARFNLRSANAIDGAATLAELHAFMAEQAVAEQG